MDCPGSERVAAYSEGCLTDAEAALFLEHCSECDECRRELALVTLARERREIPVAVPPEVKGRAVTAVLRALERGREVTPRRGHVRAFVRRPRPGWGFAAAAVLLVAVVILMAISQMREERPVVKTPAPKAVTHDVVVPEPPPPPPAPRPKLQEPPRETPVELPKPLPPRPEHPKPAPVPEPPVRDPVPPSQIEEPKPQVPPKPPSTTIAARALSELQVTDFTGSLTVRRKGAKDKERLVGVARLSEGDIVTAERPSSFHVEGRHPVVLAENASVSLAYVAQEQAPYLHIRSGEAMVDSTGPTGWIVSDGRVAMVIKQARARFATSPGEDRLHVAALSEPLYVQPDGGELQPLHPGEELRVGKSGAEVRRLDPALVQQKSAAFEAARPRQRTIFYTSCDPADARLGHFFVQEGLFVKDALHSKERPDKSSALAISTNPRIAWRDGLILRFRFMANVRELQVYLRVEERKYTIFKVLPVERKSMSQWTWVELPILPYDKNAPASWPFRRDDGDNRLNIKWGLDKFDSLRITAHYQDVFGDSKPFVLVDDIQVIEKE